MIADLDDALDGELAGEILPALVLGWSGAEVAWWRGRRMVPDSEDPAWLVRTSHQCGGYSCQQQEVGGPWLPLRRVASAVPVVDALSRLACDSPREPGIRTRPDLAPLHLTSGAA